MTTLTIATGANKPEIKKIRKAKTCKCNACGRWIANPVHVADKIYGSGCAKKAKVELVLERAAQLSFDDLIVKIMPIVQAVKINLPVATPISDIKEAFAKNQVVNLIRPDGSNREVICLAELELFPEIGMFHRKRA